MTLNNIRLSDLDELSLTVRDTVSQSYIVEAINSYRVGSYRTAIMSTWIAVSYDIISKIRELSFQGDKLAVEFDIKLKMAIAKKDILALSRLEHEFLDKAFREFEFLLEHEHVDLARLKDDRNLCAHPAFVDEESLFKPTAELVRVHIVHAILHLLQRAPVQGKSAIERIMADIKRQSFPSDIEGVSEFLDSKYLSRAKDVLIKNLIVVLLKTLFTNPDFSDKEERLINCIRVISYRHTTIYEQTMTERLSTILRGVDDSQLMQSFRLLGDDPKLWLWLDQPLQIQIKEILNKVFASLAKFPLSRFPEEYVNKWEIFDALTVRDLNPILLNLMEKIPSAYQIKVIAKNPRPEFVNKAIKLYSEASSYREAELIGEQVLLPISPHLGSKHVIQVIEASRLNRQIWDAGGMPKIIEQFFDMTRAFLPEIKNNWIEFHKFLTEARNGMPQERYQSLEKKISALI